MIGMVIGTRPEIVKMAPIVWEMEKRRKEYALVHSGQHYDYNMSEVFFKELNLRKPDFFLEVSSGSHAEQTGRIMTGIEKVVKEAGITTLVVEGDTNTVLGSAIAGKKLGCKIIHVESGARSFDKTMPEEINRILTDHVSDVLFAPTTFCKDNLENEGLKENIIVTGNTELETLDFAIEKQKKPFDVPKNFALVTVHRQENTTKEKLLILSELLSKTPFEKVFLIHPRTRKVIESNNIKFDKSVALHEPVGYFELAWLLKNCKHVVTDSGGLQKEAAYFGKPVLITRENTEWIDVVESGWGALVGLNEGTIRKAQAFFEKRMPKTPLKNTGKASQTIVDLLSLPKF